MKEKIINIFRHKNTIIILWVLFVVSVISNVYLWQQLDVTLNVPSHTGSTATTSTSVIKSPYGYTNEIVTVYDGKHTKIYSTTTPVTKADVKEMRQNVIRHQKMIDEYFRKQDQLFRSFWYLF